MTVFNCEQNIVIVWFKRKTCVEIVIQIELPFTCKHPRDSNATQRVEIELQKCLCHSATRMLWHSTKLALISTMKYWDQKSHTLGSTLIASSKKGHFHARSTTLDPVAWFILFPLEGSVFRIKGFTHPFIADICFFGLCNLSCGSVLVPEAC